MTNPQDTEDTENSLSTDVKPKSMRWKLFFARLAIRLGLLKRESIDTVEVNQLINENLPITFEIPTPGGDGELTLLQVSFHVDKEKDCIHAELLCNFSVDVKNKLIYNTHLQITVESGLEFHKASRAIGVKDVSITQLNLISDKYSIMKDTTSLLSALIPGAVKSLVNLTLTSTQVLLGGTKLSAAAQYLMIYTSGSKQKVIDYHTPTIEKMVGKLLASPDYRYILDDNDFEENLFADHGKRVSIENGKVYFIFND
ncbi:hypothetical protein FLL45_01205 [Aliikangiella marina]|uniref:DUF1439 domain-containing protein n=1 Tax=Aliikangiella marina TaxID=1712262 RepID=A0A545TH94_9GAMM|nr:hypothetical protein [Aliikangiella marina]TQV76604.1 hypothetical protein FLL45_01205 [Aliikangiella marina]